MSRGTKEKTRVSSFQPGDRVRVVDREPTPEENKQRIFYNHMRGLTGRIQRVYDQEQEVWVDVDLESLPGSVRERHADTETQMRKKWLEGLSDEARRKMSDRESRFSLRYSVIVTPGHLTLEERGPEIASPEPATEALSASAHRKTLKDLTAAEEAFLERSRTGKMPD